MRTHCICNVPQSFIFPILTKDKNGNSKFLATGFPISNKFCNSKACCMILGELHHNSITTIASFKPPGLPTALNLPKKDSKSVQEGRLRIVRANCNSPQLAPILSPHKDNPRPKIIRKRHKTVLRTGGYKYQIPGFKIPYLTFA